LNILKSIKDKLRNNKGIITKADKGNSIVVSYLNNYEDKVAFFLTTHSCIEI